MKLQLKNASTASEIQLSDAAFGRAYNEALIHQVVTAYMAGGRAGTKRQKSRAEVRGGGKKPWSQKGTGQARAGSIRSPLWVGGGVVFGPKPRDFSKTTTRKTRSLALRKALSERIKAGDVILLDDLKLATHKTKEFVKVVKALDLQGTVLFIADPDDQYLDLAARNVEKVTVTNSDTLNTYDVLRPDKLVFTRSAFEKVEARLTKE